jgi:hypothetical protein
MRRMSTDQDPQEVGLDELIRSDGTSGPAGEPDAAVPPEAASDSDGNADASPPASPEETSPEEIYEETMVRFAVITEEWQKARDALLGG